VWATTYYVSGVTSSSEEISIANDNVAPFWTPSAGMGEEGIGITTPSFTVVLETSLDGGHTFNQSTIGNFTPIPAVSPLDAVGSTVLVDPEGWPGQIAATSDGNTSMILVTTYESDEVAIEALTSVDSGALWKAPVDLAPNVGGMADPSLTTSGAGYIYAAWEERSLGEWSIDQAVFSSEGSLIQAGSQVSSGTWAIGTVGEGPSIAVDSFQRPLIIWPIANPVELCVGNCGTVGYTGAFLSPTNAVNFIQTESQGLSGWDFESGSEGSFESTLGNLVSQTNSNISLYESDKTDSVLCKAIGNAGNGLYVNITHLLVQYGLSPAGCSTTLSYLHKFQKAPANGWPEGTQGENASSASSLLPTLGALTGNTMLALIGDWALEALSLPVNASADPLRLYIPGIGLATMPSPLSGYPAADGESGNITILPQPTNPTTASLEVQSGAFPTYTDTWSWGDPYCPHLQEYLPVKYTETWSAVRYYSNVSVEGSSTQSFTSTTGLPTIYLTNLTPNATSTWSGTYNGAYSGEETVTTCLVEVGPTQNSSAHDSGWPHHLSYTFTSSVTTTERIVGTRVVYSQVSGDIYSYWNNTMPASATATLMQGSNYATQIQGTSGYHVADTFGWNGITLNKSYSLSLSTSSHTGAWNATEAPAASAGQVTSSPALPSGYSCLFVADSNSISIWGESYTNLNGGNVTLHWFSKPLGGTGWITYYAVGSGKNMTQTAYVERNWTSNHTQEWVTELHGLFPGLFIEVHVYSAFTSGCYTTFYSASTLINTDNGFAAWEVDNPYDSISQTGGGGVLYWELPWAVPSQVPFIGGTLLVWNDTSYTTYTTQNISSLWEVNRFGNIYGANITPINLNQKYSSEVFLNFTYSGSHTTLQSDPTSFVYQKDTSGDGLTDAEKSRGWIIPVANAWGGYSNGNGTTWVQANPNLWATNGLVNDYIEKEYDLDPQTIDTAHSHMLDTWNLTFNLGSNNETCPVDFRCWFENSTNPLPNGYIGNGSATNFSATGPSSQGDSYSWAAKILWSKSEIPMLRSLITTEGVGWLRAETGTDGGISTLTVWGKLSWGANPLVASTINDGIPDGSRVSSISVVGIQLTRVFGNASGSLANGAGFAMKMILFNGSGTSGTQELSNYSLQGLIDQTSITNYSVLLPVNQSYQFATLEIQVIADNNSVLSAMWLNSTATSFTRTIDLAGSAITSYSYSGNGVKTYWGQISGKIQPVWTGYKVPTWLWLPDSNSTVNGLPTGLERYTGEQSFDMVVVNSSSAITSQSVPLPWGGDAASPIALASGLNDFLIPREQFLLSPFGQAVLLGKATAYNSSNPYPVLVGTSGRGVISHFGGANWMVDLGAYWQNRAINTGATGNITPSTETGTSPTSYLNVQVMAATQTLWNNTGSVAAVSGLYNASDAPPAVQTVVTLNVTNQTNLDLLIAALYDNTTGGASAVNGTFQSITFAAESLNLLPSVLSAIPNIAVVGDGLYVAPVSVPPPPAPSFWGGFWNAVTSVITTPLGAILSLATIVWSATVSAMTYLNHLAHEALALGGQVLARVAATLVSIGKEILSLAEALLDFIVQLVTKLVELAFQPLFAAESAYALDLNQTSNAMYAQVAAQGTVSTSEATAFGNALEGSIFWIAIAVGVVVEIAATLLTPIALGPEFLVGIILQIVIVGVLALTGGFSSAIGALTAAAVYSVENIANVTDPLFGSVLNAINWRTFAIAFGMSASIVSMGVVSGLIRDDEENPFLVAIVFVLGIISLSLDFWSLIAKAPLLETLSIIFGAVGVVVGVYHIARSNSMVQITAGIATGLSVAGLGASLYASGDLQI